MTPADVHHELDRWLQTPGGIFSKFEYCDWHIGENVEHARYRLSKHNEYLQIVHTDDFLCMNLTLAEPFNPSLLTVIDPPATFHLKLLNICTLSIADFKPVKCTQNGTRGFMTNLSVDIEDVSSTDLAVAVLETLLIEFRENKM